MGERMLTVRDRIIVHLSGYNRFADDFECPEEMCQSGISAAIEKSRAHVTLELNRMKNDGIVSERVAHVNGAKSRRKTYSLTQIGTVRNAEITEYLESMNIEIIDSRGVKAFSGIAAAEYLRTNFNMPHVLAVDRVLASGGILNMTSPAPTSPTNAAAEAHLPMRTADFVPRKELTELTEMLGRHEPEIVVLLGVPGIGKTSILSELAWTLPRDEVLFRRIYTYDTANSVLAGIGQRMNSRGQPSLINYLSHADALDLTEAAIHLAEFLRRRKTVLIFDEYDQASEKLVNIFVMLSETIKGTESKIIIGSSRKPEFYGKKEIVLEKRVTEIALSPLDADASAELLRRHCGNSLSERNLQLAGGHPLALKLMASGMPVSNLAEFVEKDILGGNPELAKLCRFASVLRKPFIPDDLELLGMGSASDVCENPAFERHTEGGFMLHPAVSTPLKAAMSGRLLKELHRTAAQFYLEADEDLHESLYHLTEAGDLERAREMAISGWDELSDSGDRENLAACLERLALSFRPADMKLMGMAANAYDQVGKWARAEELADKIAESTPGTEEAFGAMILKSKIQAKTGRTEDALTVLDSILKNGKKPTAIIAGQAHYAKACALRRLDRLAPAMKECEKALAISLENSDGLLHSRSLMEYAMILSSKGQHQASMEILTEASSFFAGSGSLQDRIRLAINRGMVLKSLERNDEAEAELEKAVKLAEDAGLNRLRAHGLANLTELLNMRKDYRRSADLATQASNIFSILGEPTMVAVSKFNLGTAMAGLDRKEEAIEILDDAVSILEKQGLTKARATWIREYADLLKDMGEEKKAAGLLDTHGI